MKKRVFGVKLSRSRTARQAMYRSLVRSLVLTGQIKTTIAKAKAVRRFTDKLISKAKKNTISATRQVLSELANDRDTTNALVKKALEYKRTSGFTRIVPMPQRRGDNAKMAVLELLAEEVKEKVEKEKVEVVKEDKKAKTK